MHILSTITTKRVDLLQDEAAFLARVQSVIEQTGTTNLGQVSHKFPNEGGFTTIVCLAESHLAVHTWPELGIVTLDVYLCNYLHDNTAKCEAIYQQLASHFDPASDNVTRLIR